jgi:sulfite reductase alpha subunit-like flavoprotein
MLLQEDAYILVAGSASTKMPSDVRNALARVCEEAGGMSPTEAQQFLLRMEKRRRFCVEAWS